MSLLGSAGARSNTKLMAYCLSMAHKRSRMLVHITPRFLPDNSNQKIRLLEVSLSSKKLSCEFTPFLSGKLADQPHMLTFAPKACSKQRSGIFFDVTLNRERNEFDVNFLWEIDGFSEVIQTVHYHLLDSKNNAFSDEPSIWAEMINGPVAVSELKHPRYSQAIFMASEPELLTCANTRFQSSMGLITSVEQHFFGPSIESARLIDPKLRRFTPRLPLPRSII